MPDAREDVQPAGAEAGEDLAPEFSYEDLAAEIAKFAGNPPRQPGDIDKWEIAKATGKSLKAAETIIAKAVASGEYVRLLAYDPARHHDVIVIRKVK